MPGLVFSQSSECQELCSPLLTITMWVEVVLQQISTWAESLLWPLPSSLCLALLPLWGGL
jgi:hypothetical protein